MKLVWPAVLLFLLFAGSVQAVGPGSTLVYEGKGAGEVVFDGSVHQGFACEECHEPRGLTPALFEMKRGESWITMKKMERGRSCGYCHEIIHTDTQCSICHKKS